MVSHGSLQTLQSLVAILDTTWDSYMPLKTGHTVNLEPVLVVTLLLDLTSRGRETGGSHFHLVKVRYMLGDGALSMTWSIWPPLRIVCAVA